MEWILIIFLKLLCQTLWGKYQKGLPTSRNIWLDIRLYCWFLWMFSGNFYQLRNMGIRSILLCDFSIIFFNSRVLTLNPHISFLYVAWNVLVYSLNTPIKFFFILSQLSYNMYNWSKFMKYLYFKHISLKNKFYQICQISIKINKLTRK